MISIASMPVGKSESAIFICMIEKLIPKRERTTSMDDNHERNEGKKMRENETAKSIKEYQERLRREYVHE
jgi:hypothetical protein